MKCPLVQEQINQFLIDLEDDKKRNEFLQQQIKRFQDISNGLLSKEEIFEGTFYDLLYNIYQFKNADMETPLVQFNDVEMLEQIFEGYQISIRINDFVVLINKPTTFGEMSKLKNTFINDLSFDEANDIIILQKKLKGIIKIYKKDMEIDDISSVNYMEASVFFFATPIIYQILLLLINSLGSYSKKK